MNFSEAISACFNKYATFSGRSRRSEYWFFYLFYVLVVLAAAILEVATGLTDVFTTIAYLVLLLPQIAAGVRRMHDTNRSGWWLLVPIANLVFLATEGDKVANRFGEPTK